MAKKAKEAVKIITLKSADGRSVYHTRKNSKNTQSPLSFKKYNPRTRQHEVFKESKH